LADAIQALAAVLALLIAPTTLRQLRDWVLGRPKAIFFARKRTSGRNPVWRKYWYLNFRHQSPRHLGRKITVIPASQGNRIASVRLLTPAEAGLSYKAAVVRGALEIEFERFHQSRKLDLAFRFESADEPIIMSEGLHPRVEYLQLSKSGHPEPTMILAVMQQRLMTFSAMFVAIGAAIILRLVMLGLQSLRL
jgi:hypothetical protein